MAILALACAPGLSFAMADPAETDPTKAIGSALSKGSFPWYDVSKDQAKPIAAPKPPEVPELPSGNWSWLGFLGNVMSLLIFSLALAALVGLMAWFWRVYQPIASVEAEPRSKGPGLPSRVEALPEGLRRGIKPSDPWEEAIRRRDRGDLAGAVICLFAHQLLTLSKLGLIRLAPGRTGRQLLRAVVEAEFRALVQPTLRLFESSYYGHRAPTSEEFADLWQHAEAFELRAARGVMA
jgi:hypothetical protein